MTQSVRSDSADDLCGKIVNLTQHRATPEQVAEGVFDLQGEVRNCLHSLLTFEELPSRMDIASRAQKITDLACATGAAYAMLGGAPYLMAPLEEALRRVDIIPLYAFSRREVSEEVTADGVKKTMVFRHLGFVGKEER